MDKIQTLLTAVFHFVIQINFKLRSNPCWSVYIRFNPYSVCDERICKKRRRAVLYYSDISKIDQSERLEFPARPVCRQSCFARPSGPCQAGNRRAAPERSFWTVENARTCMSLICVKFRNNLFNSWAVSIAEYGCFYLVLINVAILVVKYYFFRFRFRGR